MPLPKSVLETVGKNVGAGALGVGIFGVAVLAVVLGLGACGERVEAGLANAPSLERKSVSRQGYDVIAVGDEGCTNRDGGSSMASSSDGCKQNAPLLLADAASDPSR
jgi:hypothetical protein